MQLTPRVTQSAGEERKSVTDTDLFTAGESTDDNQLSNAVTTDTPDVKPTASVGSLATMVLPELRALANQAGVKGTSGMRKNELIAAIQEIRDQANGASAAGAPEDSGKTDTATAEAPAAQGEKTQGKQNGSTTEAPRRERRSAAREAETAPRAADEADREGSSPREGRATAEARDHQGAQQDTKTDERGPDAGSDQGGDQQDSGAQQSRGDEDGEGRQGRRGRRFRDNYAFVRTSGYLAGPHDVYVSMNMVRKNGLRRGDAVTGAVRVPRDGEQPNQRQKFNPLVRLDSVNGGSVEDAKKRPDFSKLTPLYPNQRLRLETTPDRLTTRVIDLIMPIGKGQRALIVSPPKAGKTTILQDIANAITKNNPECHLMVVLVDERPEEVTDMTRSVKGEVIASTFDRPPSDHTSNAPSALSSRAKTSWCYSTRSPAWDAPTTMRRRRRAASCPVVSTPPRCTRPSGSSAPHAILRKAAR
jgi:transcription termination factor Rho